MLVRIRCKDGQFRYTLDENDTVDVLVQHLLASIEADPATLALADAPRGEGRSVAQLQGSTLKALGITHGQLLYAEYETPTGAGASASPATSAQPTQPTAPTTSSVRMDDVDTYWAQQRGLIQRARDPQFCRHGEKGMCDYCMPLEPYDAGYQAEHNIKHLSFHAYLRQQNISTSTASTSSTYIPPLEEVNYRVLTPCPSGHHAPWPAGICTKCQPSAITLQRQVYRMVDHVEFAHPSLIDHMLETWRKTAMQRFGFLLGHYEPYDKVPMGIKAVVEAIHEPPQAGEMDGLTLGWPWDDQDRITALAQRCGLQIVGMIYTDLEAADPTHTDATKAGLVACKRHADSFFLSGQEALFAAQWQAQRRSACRWSKSGVWNSKFVTCVLSGNTEGEIDVAAYQVSEQAMGMVEADMIEASVHPTIIRVKPNDATRYVPDVFYRYTNKYGIDVKERASPTFPVEYLLTTSTHGFPTDPSPRFLSHAFAIENRPGLHDQSLDDVWRAMHAFLPLESDTQRTDLMQWLSDWHLLAFLGQSGFLSDEEMQWACDVATHHDTGARLDQLLASSGWQTLCAIAREHAPRVSNDEHDADMTAAMAQSLAESTQPPASGDAHAESQGTACPHCTFLNPPGHTDCDVCGLPL